MIIQAATRNKTRTFIQNRSKHLFVSSDQVKAAAVAVSCCRKKKLHKKMSQPPQASSSVNKLADTKIEFL